MTVFGGSFERMLMRCVRQQIKMFLYLDKTKESFDSCEFFFFFFPETSSQKRHNTDHVTVHYYVTEKVNKMLRSEKIC